VSFRVSLIEGATVDLKCEKYVKTYMSLSKTLGKPMVLRVTVRLADKWAGKRAGAIDRETEHLNIQEHYTLTWCDRQGDWSLPLHRQAT
jgi:hypothetical protein